MVRKLKSNTRGGGREDDRNRSEYQRQYYQDHSETLSADRKRKYREDPAYRDAVLAQVRAYRKTKREERDRLRAEGVIPTPSRGGPRAPLNVVVNGVSTVAYSIGRVAVELGRSAETLKYWTRVGLLPQTPLRSEGGDRLYTEGMMIILRIALAKRSRVSMADRDLPREVRNGWEGLGIQVPR